MTDCTVTGQPRYFCECVKCSRGASVFPHSYSGWTFQALRDGEGAYRSVEGPFFVYLGALPESLTVDNPEPVIFARVCGPGGSHAEDIYRGPNSLDVAIFDANCRNAQEAGR